MKNPKKNAILPLLFVTLCMSPFSNYAIASDKQTQQASMENVKYSLDTATSIEQLKDKNAKIVTLDNDDTYEFSEGLCSVHRDNLWGFIDTLGNIVIDFKFQSRSNSQPKFNSGICSIGMNTGENVNAIVCIDKKGTVLFTNKKYSYVSSYSGGIAIAERKLFAPYISLINTKGEPIPGAITPNLVAISWSPDFLNFSDGLSVMYDRIIDGSGYINTKGQWVIKPSNKYSEYTAFNEGLAFVLDKISGKWGAIDTKGLVVIPFQFINKPGSFSEGLASVENREGMAGYIDKSGKVVINCLYKDAQPFVNGHAILLKDDKYVSVDKSGGEKQIPELSILMQVHPSGNSVFEGKNPGSRGLISSSGEVILNPDNYTQIGKFNNGLAHAESRIDDKWIRGFINMSGKYVIIFAEQEF